MRMIRLLWWCWLPLGVQAAELRDIRIWAGPESTRVVFDLSATAGHSVFTLENPDRIVIDLPQVARGARVDGSVGGRGVVSKVRSATQPDGRLRVVLDVSEAVKPRSFILTPSGDYGHRLVVDLYAQGPILPAPTAVTEVAALHAPSGALQDKPIIIAIDAGHGGEDPGARGPNGVLEKDVALAMARRLARLVDAEPGFKAVMVRDGDYFVPLRERIDFARRNQADLFVSVHANAYRDSSVRGSAVYALSRRGATSEQARWLASRENASDLVGGVELSDKDDTLAHVLFDISQTAAIEASLDAGSRVLASLGQVNHLQRREVQQAGFLVLKAPDIPSILVETAFITNPGEERMLRDAQHQARLAQAILDGIRGYFENYRPLRYVAVDGSARNHVVRRGETLSQLAQRYRVSQGAIKTANGLSSDMVRIGDVLQIPAAY